MPSLYQQMGRHNSKTPHFTGKSNYFSREILPSDRLFLEATQLEGIDLGGGYACKCDVGLTPIETERTDVSLPLSSISSAMKERRVTRGGHWFFIMIACANLQRSSPKGPHISWLFEVFEEE